MKAAAALLLAGASLAPAAGAQDAAGPFLPSSHLRFDVTPEELALRCEQAVGRAQMGLKELATLPAAARTFANTPAALDQTLWTLYDEESSDGFLKEVAVSSAVRQASLECQTRLDKFTVDVFTREDLFGALQAYAAKGEPLQGEDARLLKKELEDYRRNGLLLPSDRRDAAKKLRQRLVELEEKFEKNLVEVRDALWLSKDQLAGLPDDYVARLPRDGERAKVTVDYPDYFPFMENAKDAEARRRLEALFDDRAYRQNEPLLKEMLSLREEAARLLGYKSHAAYVLEERMARDPATVERFIDRLVARLKPMGRRELAELVALKDAELGGKSDHRIHAWDWRYYDNQLRKKRYAVDEEKVKDYFPMQTVTDGLLAVYQQLLGLRFRRIERAALWHPDVSLYEITDPARQAEPIGYFYMDLFPRDGKFKHAAAFSLVTGRILPEGTYQKPVAAIVANFEKPAPGRPSLLRHGEHGEVETFFHEFGHIMHQTLTKARYGRFSGSNVAQDFVEAPSQMLENWVWSPQIIDRLSGRYDDPSKKLPPDLLSKMIEAKNIDAGLKNLRQMLFASADMAYHRRAVNDPTRVWERYARCVSLIAMQPGTHPEASFGHLVGYDAGYYGYMWSKVYAQDMFTLFEREGLLNPAVGRRYREQILEKGASVDEMELLKGFLGRQPNEDAFLRSIGLAAHGDQEAR